MISNVGVSSLLKWNGNRAAMGCLCRCASGSRTSVAVSCKNKQKSTKAIDLFPLKV